MVKWHKTGLRATEARQGMGHLIPELLHPAIGKLFLSPYAFPMKEDHIISICVSFIWQNKAPEAREGHCTATSQTDSRSNRCLWRRSISTTGSKDKISDGSPTK